MKAHYLRFAYSETFLVPEDVIEAFDALVEMEGNEDADNEFSNRFWQYKREGELSSIKLFIEE